MSVEKHDPTLAGLEAALAALRPLPGQLDRDALLFRAGQLSAARRTWLWPGTASGLGLAAVVLGLLLVFQPAPAPTQRVVYIPIKEPVPPAVREETPLPEPESVPSVSVVAEQTSVMNYLQLQKQIARWGLDGVPDMSQALPPSRPPLTRDEVLGVPAEPASFTSFFDLRSLFQ